MTAYTVGLNTGNTGSLIANAINNSAPTSVLHAGLVNIASTSSAAIGRLVVLLAFPVSGAGTVTNATLKLRNQNGTTGTRAFQVRSLINTPTMTEVTWNKRNTATNWDVAGALTGTDVNSTVIATGTSSTGAGTSINLTGAGLDAWVQGCIAGTNTCLALIVSAETEGAGEYTGVPTDAASSGVRPVLTFDFVPATPPSVSGADVLCTKYDGTTTITVTLSEAAPVGGCSVDYTTQDSTAIAGQHYTAMSGTFTFAQGEQTKTATVTIAP